MVKFDIIVAVDAKGGIGKNGGLPWNLSGDMKHFKELTAKTKDSSKRNAVIMGRKTWDSILEKFRPLAKRINVVITRNKDLSFPEGVIKAAGLDDALVKLQEGSLKEKTEKIFVIGGEQIFAAALKHPGCQKLHLTHIRQTFECDTFLPDYKKKFQLSKSSEPVKEGNSEYYFSEYLKIA